MGRVLGEEGRSDVRGMFHWQGRGCSRLCWGVSSLMAEHWGLGGGGVNRLEEYKVPLLAHLCTECPPAHCRVLGGL